MAKVIGCVWTGIMSRYFLVMLVSLFGLLSSVEARVAVVLSTKGLVQVQTKNNQVKNLQRRSPIFEGDTIITGTETRCQIRYNDGTSVAIRPNSAFKVARYRYQANAPKQNNMLIQMTKGKIRLITGAINKKNKDAFKIETPVATLGVRGTNMSLAADEVETALSVTRGEVIGSSRLSGKSVVFKGHLDTGTIQKDNPWAGVFNRRTFANGGFKQLVSNPPATMDIVSSIPGDHIPLEARLPEGVYQYSPDNQLVTLLTNESNESELVVLDLQEPAVPRVVTTTTTTTVVTPPPMPTLPDMPLVGAITISGGAKGIRAISSIPDPVLGGLLASLSAANVGAGIPTQSEYDVELTKGSATLTTDVNGNTPGVFPSGARWGAWQNGDLLATDINSNGTNLAQVNSDYSFWIIGSKTAPTPQALDYKFRFRVNDRIVGVDHTGAALDFAFFDYGDPFLNLDTTNETISSMGLHVTSGAHTFKVGTAEITSQSYSNGELTLTTSGGEYQTLLEPNLTASFTGFTSDTNGNYLNLAFKFVVEPNVASAQGIFTLSHTP